MRWSEKAPEGGLRRVMDVKAESGTLDAEQESGRMNRASGLLYRENRPRARFIAPVVEAARNRGLVTARGGVTVYSIDPPGGKLTADRITWYARQDKIVAMGNVSIEYRPPNAPAPTAWGGPYPRATLHTERWRFTIP